MKSLLKKFADSKHTILIVTILLFLGLMSRLFLATILGFKIDTDAWFAWSIRLVDGGFSNFYSKDVWTNYTPGYFYVLYFLGQIKNFFQLNSESFYILLKLPSIFADLILGYLIFHKLKKVNKPFAFTGLIFYLFNPVSLFNSSIWGQIDAFLALFMFLSVDQLLQKKYYLSGLFWAIALLIKPQAIALAPAFGFYFLRHFNIKRILQVGITSLITILILSFPFFPQDPFFGVFKLVAQMAQDYPGNSMFAFNLWGIFGFWLPDSTQLTFLSYRSWGFLTLVLFWIIILFFYYKKNLNILSITILALMSFYFLPTRVHERYLFPVFPFLIYFALKFKSKILILLTLLLSFSHFINLYYVYVYYNELFLKNPPVLYIPNFYELIQNNSSTLSLLSTILFALITGTLIFTKTKHETAQ